MNLISVFIKFSLIVFCLLSCSIKDIRNKNCKKQVIKSLSNNEMWMKAKNNNGTNYIEDTLLNNKEIKCEDFKDSCKKFLNRYRDAEFTKNYNELRTKAKKDHEKFRLKTECKLNYLKSVVDELVIVKNELKKEYSELTLKLVADSVDCESFKQYYELNIRTAIRKKQKKH